MKKVILAAAVAALLTIGATAQTQSQTQKNTGWNQQKEASQEKASGINDAVDIVNGPTVQNLSSNSATLTWETNKNAATRVRYGTDQVNPSEHAYAPGGTTQHSVQLTNLKPNTTYHYEIESRGGKDRFKGSFKTP
jgi:hypothetical protein